MAIQGLGGTPDERPTVEVWIQDGATRQPVRATVRAGIHKDEAAAVDAAWLPHLILLLGRIVTENPNEHNLPEHFHWIWSDKVAHYSSTGSKTSFFALECDGSVQGMMAITLGPPSRLEASKGAELVYVDYIATAPWNNAKLVSSLGEHPRYRAVGSALLEIAVQNSFDRGLRGKIGLHALPQAVTFYRDACNMTEVGPDEEQKQLIYFEFTEEQARSFLAEE